tara:strand:- start:160 stop:1551 length:1392 start_codon:yes stop_codon:yes gene_type:complete
MKKNLTLVETFDLAVQNQKKNNFQVAINLFKEILKVKPNHFNSILSLGSLMLQIKKFVSAKTLLEKATKIDPNNIIAQNNLGLTLKELGEPLKAIICFEKVIKMDSNFSIAYNNLGTSFKELGKLQKAISCYEKAIKANSKYLSAYNNLGLTFMELEEYKKAIDCYEKAIEIDPNFANTHNNLGVTFLELKEYKKATICFEKAIQINPKHLDALNNLLRFLYKMNDQNTFLKQLDERIKQGEINALIGSLITRSEIRYGIKRVNPFCETPLNYILQSNLNETCNFKNIFINAVKNIIQDDKLLRRKQNLLTNGYQTAGNLFAQKNDLVDEIKRVITFEISKYQTHFKNSNEGLIKKWPKNYNLNGWLVSMKSGGKLSSHIHEKGWISGSIYINVPPKLKSNSGNLVVCIDEKEKGTEKKTNQEKIIDVVTGSICIFPSSLYHYTIPFDSDEERIVLAFDVMPN